jgi:hypothetical protein
LVGKTLYLDGAAYDAASREQDKVERAKLKPVGMLARKWFDPPCLS